MILTDARVSPNNLLGKRGAKAVNTSFREAADFVLLAFAKAFGSKCSGK